jgi:site-specific recombinase XerD
VELFYFRHELLQTSELRKAAKRLGIPEGQPFVTDEQGVPLDQFCAMVGLSEPDIKSLITGSQVYGISYPSDINDYLLDRTSTAKSRNTWKTEAEQLCLFLRWVKAQEWCWSELTLEDFRSFYRTRRLQPSPHTGRPISDRTWNACIGAVIRFYRWAADTGRIKQLPFTYRQIQVSPTEVIEKNSLTASVSEGPIRYLTLEEYKIFRAALGLSRNGGRDQAFGDTLVSTGMRLSEGNGLTIDTPDPDAPRYRGVKTIRFKITGKGGKTRTIRFPKSALRVIEIYKGEDRANAIARWKARTPNGRVMPASLWLTERGTPMSTARWEEIFQAASERCGIHCTPHMLRHTFAIYALSALIKRMIGSINELRQNGTDRLGKLIEDPLRELADLLGHKHIATTFTYLHLVEQCEALVDDAIAEWADGIFE